MKLLCISDLDKFKLSRTSKTFVKTDTKEYYIFEECCEVCGEPYMRSLKSTTFCCSLTCAQTGRKNHEYGKSGIKNPWYGKKHDHKTILEISSHSKGRNNSSWKGGVIKDNLPLYDTYAHQLSFVEEVRFKLKNKIKLLEVRCKYCKNWFVPKRTNVRHRAAALNNPTNCKEHNFYCSDLCRTKCPVFRKWERGIITHSIYTNSELRCWSAEVLRRANFRCEICGAIATQAHHIRPKKTEPRLALDPDNGMAVCKRCHHRYGHSDSECSYRNLSNTC